MELLAGTEPGVSSLFLGGKHEKKNYPSFFHGWVTELKKTGQFLSFDLFLGRKAGSKSL